MQFTFVETFLPLLPFPHFLATKRDINRGLFYKVHFAKLLTKLSADLNIHIKAIYSCSEVSQRCRPCFCISVLHQQTVPCVDKAAALRRINVT